MHSVHGILNALKKGFAADGSGEVMFFAHREQRPICCPLDGFTLSFSRTAEQRRLEGASDGKTFGFSWHSAKSHLIEVTAIGAFVPIAWTGSIETKRIC